MYSKHNLNFELQQCLEKMQIAVNAKRYGAASLTNCATHSDSWPKSLYRSRAGRHFYGTENEIWAGFGPVGNTEKKNGQIMSYF